MKLRNALAFMLLAACGAREERTPFAIPSAAATPPAAAAVAEPPRIVKGAPHGSEIVRIAATEEGDAALTVDVHPSLRLWPTLDGSRPPVPIATPSEPKQLGLLRAGADLVAIVLDAGGGVQLTRLGLDGTQHGRVQLEGELFEEAIAVGDAVLTRSSDHAIELFDVDGTSRGRLVPEPGEHITHIAARRGRAAAIVTNATGARLRWLSVSPRLQWDVAFALPSVPAPGMLAIAPSRRRIAYAATGTFSIAVLDVDFAPVPVEGDLREVNATHTALGFIDDDTLAASGSTLVWWKRKKVEPPPADPWEVADISPTRSSHAAAFTNGRVISAEGASLALLTPTNSQFLGWEFAAYGALTRVGSGLVLDQSSRHFLWLDDDLQRTRSVDLQADKSDDSWAYGQPVGDHHLISQTHAGETSTLSLLHADRPNKPIPIVEAGRIDQYSPSSDVIAVAMQGGPIRRFKLDVATSTVTEMLPAVRIRGYSRSFVRGFDPALANGLVMVAVAWVGEYDDYQTLITVRLDKGQLVQTKETGFQGQVLRADPDGTLVMLDHKKGARIRVVRDGKTIREIAREPLVQPIAIDAEAKRFAMHDHTDVFMLDEHGQELWRCPVWGVSNVLMSGNDKRVIVVAPGGLVALDASTGEPITRECGFDFGLHAKPPVMSPVGLASVCEDPIVQ